MSLILSGTEGVGDVDGSAATPAIRGTDTNTGIFFPAADTIAFAEGGVESARFDSAGNMGLGVTPSASTFPAIESSVGIFMGRTENNLGVNAYFNSGWKYTASSTAATRYRQNAGEHQWYNAPSGTAGNAISFTQAMTLDASGNLGVGTTSPGGNASNRQFSLVGSSTAQATLTGSGSFSVNLGTNGTFSYLESTSTAPLVLVTNGAERARIDSSGNLLVGTTSIGYDGTNTGIWLRGGLNVLQASRNNDPAAGFARTGTDGDVVTFDKGATFRVGWIAVTTTATTYNTSSDYRLKNTIAPMTGALEKVALLKPCTYKWNADGSDGQGFIAHELAEVCPQAVTGEKDATRMEQYEISPAVPATFDEEGNELTAAVQAVIGEREVPSYQGIDTSFLVATLTAAIQEQQALIQTLTARVAALEGAQP